MLAVVFARETVLAAGAGVGARGALAGRPTARFPTAPSAREAANCGPGVGWPGRRLATGSRTAATSAATQTACRWLAGPRRSMRQARRDREGTRLNSSHLGN